MSEHKQRQSAQAQAPKPLEPSRIVPIPDAEGRLQPVLAVNGVRVTGGVDSLVIDFFNVDMAQLAIVLRGFEKPDPAKNGMRSLADGALLVEGRPLARLSLPANVIVDLVVQAVAVLGESVPRLKTQLENAGPSIMEAIAAVQSAVGGKPESST